MSPLPPHWWFGIALLVGTSGVAFAPNTARAQNVYPNPVYFSSLAGGTLGTANGTGSAAQFRGPVGLAVDTAGNVYVGDSFNHTIRKITAAGVVTTFAGAAGTSGSTDGTGTNARFNMPRGVALEANGNLLVADYFNHTIRRITPAGVVTTIFGAAGASGATDATGTAARFNMPSDIALDASGNLYVADEVNHTIRKITPAGVVSTVAGVAGLSGTTNGTGAVARFNFPVGIAVDASGNVFVAEVGTHTIRKITPAAVVTTLAGLGDTFGNTDGTGSAARFAGPFDVAVDPNGNVVVADQSNQLIRHITPQGVVTTLAGSTQGFTDGLGNQARFSNPQGLTVDTTGRIYLADSGNNRIRRSVFPPTFTQQPASLTVTAGSAATLSVAVASELPATLQWNRNGTAIPGATATSISIPGTAAADAGTYTVTATSAAGTTTSAAATLIVIPYFLTVLAGDVNVPGATDAIGTAARFNGPSSIAVDGVGNIYVADRDNHTIRKVTPSGAVTTLAGSAGTPGSTDGSGSAARFRGPRSVSLDASGNLLVADTYNHAIRKITPAGAVTTIAGTPGKIGTRDGAGSVAQFNVPNSIAVDRINNVYYVSDAANFTIRKITSAGVVSTLAGAPGVFGDANGTGSAARFSRMEDLEVDSRGNLYATDSVTEKVRRISTTGVVTTFAGSSRGHEDGVGEAARFGAPFALGIDSRNNLYVGEAGPGGDMRRITPDRMVTTIEGLSGRVAGLAIDARGNLYVTIKEALFRTVFPPVISQQPADRSTFLGIPATFTANATSDYPMTFQWRRNGSAIAGATNTTLVLGVADALAGTYTFAATNIAGTTISNAATLTVTQIGATPPVITTQPVSQVAVAGATVQFNVVSSPPGTSFIWRKNNITLASATSATLTLSNITLADAGDYRVIVFSIDGTATSNIATLSVITQVTPVIITQPVSQTVAIGSTVEFSVDATPEAGTTYQWRKSELAPINGATSDRLVIENVTLADASTYNVVVTNSGSSVTSASVTLTVVAPPVITTQPQSLTVAVGAVAQFTVAATPTTGTTFQWFKNGAAIASATSSLFRINSATLTDPGSYTVVVTNSAVSTTSNPATLTVTAPAGFAPVFNAHPVDQTVTAGTSIQLNVSVSGSQPISFQWFRNGAAISGAITTIFNVAAAQASDEGSYTVIASNSTGTAASNAAAVRVILPPSIATQPASQTATVGTNIRLTVAVNGTSPFNFQWRKEGNLIADATTSALALNAVQLTDAGDYSVTITNPAGLANSATAALTVNPPGPPSRLSNLSVRTTLAAGQIVIVGIAVAEGSRNVLVRAVGPTLSQFNVSGAMADPRLELFRGQTLVTANDDWPATLAPAIAGSGAFPLTLGSRDAAFSQSLDGTFSIQARGTGAGVVLVEAYDLGTGNTPRLVNVSARNRVGTGDDILIAGFTIAGTGTKQVLIRAVGPGLAALGVTGTLVDPRLDVFSSANARIAENDNWTANLATTFASVGAFPLPNGSRDAALLTTLPVGSYTVQVRGADNGTGEAIVEVYEVP